MKKGLLMLVAVLLVLGSALVPADSASAAKSTRTAQVIEVEGDAHITKNGGSKEFRLFKGMTLNQGDYLVTGPGAKVVLVIADREDEVTIGENASVYISELSGMDTAKKSKLKMWAGSVWSKVKSLVNAEDEFEVETPTAVMGVRGTQFLIVFDPLTGKMTMTVASGIVAAQPVDPVTEYPTAVVLPLRVFQWYEEAKTEDPSENITFMDLDTFFETVNRDIIEKLILETAQLHEEVERLREASEQNPDLGEPPTPLDVTNTLSYLLKEAMDRNILEKDEVETIVNQANQRIPVDERKYDLERDIPAPDAVTGVDPEEEARKKEQLKQKEEARKKRLEETERTKQSVKEENREAYERLLQQKEEQERQNNQSKEERKQEALERTLEELTEEERQALLDRVNRREEETKQQREASESKQNAGSQEGQQDPAGGGGNSGNPGGQPGGQNQPNKVHVNAGQLITSGQEMYARFDLTIELENVSNLAAAELHLAVPYGVSKHASGQGNLGESPSDPWETSDIFHSANAVTHWRTESGVVIGDDLGDELIFAALLKLNESGINPIQFTGKKTLISVPLMVNGVYLSDKDSIVILVDLILVDGDGNEIITPYSTEIEIELPDFDMNG